MPRKEDIHRLYHIWAAATEAIGYMPGRQCEDLAKDRPLQHSLVRMLEVIGEAAGKVSPAFRDAHPEIPRQAMVGMRNRIVHAYFDINLTVVWRTVTEDLPPLLDLITPILVEEGLVV